MINATEPKRVPADFEPEKELATNDAQRIREHDVGKDYDKATGIGILVLDLLEEMGVSITRLKAADKMIVEAARTRYIVIANDNYNGIKLALPTLETLAALPDRYFGRQVILPVKGIQIPYSFARVGDEVYVRCHLSKEEFERKADAK